MLQKALVSPTLLMLTLYRVLRTIRMMAREQPSCVQHSEAATGQGTG